jgi:phosphatidylserine/phosphatidylglycerophosphate/cardiolipin synthase-like enzyme
MRAPHNKLATVLLLLLAFCAHAAAQSLPAWLSENCAECEERMSERTGVYILEKGEESLIGRAWLTQNVAHTIDVQYFIWSTDNVGTLAAEQLLRAAERGIRVRVLVDDLLVDAQGKTLLLLSAHPNAEIRIYNPNISVGVNWWQRLKNAVTSFRMVNQRMHDKTAIFDGIAGITGGRNMADEYFDFNHTYNFRDRDVLLLGPAVSEMSENFEELFSRMRAWASRRMTWHNERANCMRTRRTRKTSTRKFVLPLCQRHDYFQDSYRRCPGNT